MMLTEKRSLSNSIEKLLLLLLISSCSKPIESNKKLIGLNEQEVIERYNNPSVNKVISLTSNTPLHEYESNLYKLFPKRRSADTVKIKELMWLRDGNTEVIWLINKKGKWVVIDHLKWSKEINF